MPDRDPTAIEARAGRSGGGRFRRMAPAIGCGLGLCWALSRDPGPASRPAGADLGVATVAVDRGDIAQVVTESGWLESAGDAVIRCRVESFQGLPAVNSASPGSPGRGGRTSGSGAAGSASSGARSLAAAAAARNAMPVNRPGVAKAVKDRAQGQGNGASPALPTGRSPSAPAAPVAAGSASNRGNNDATIARQRPEIRSFAYIVEPHIPLLADPEAQVPGSGQAPPPTILSILPEGTRVDAGDVVCRLNSSAFRVELQVQEVRCVQAQARVNQARSLLEASTIALREYQDGIFPQDVALIRRHIRTCQTNWSRADRNLDWSRAVAARGYRTSSQVKADAATYLDAELAVRDARGMLDRLLRFTGPRIITARRAKLQAIRADLLSLQATYQLACERRNRLEAMVANCTVRAPRDGIVVHANRSNAWGTPELRIREGLIVYPSQRIFRLLDPRRMQVKARINESHVARIRTGQRAVIRLEALPDHPLRGTVTAITPIPAPAIGFISDVHAYLATVQLEPHGLDRLRDGLSARVDLQVAIRRRVARIPLEAIRWVDGRTYVALAITALAGPSWQWRPVELGVSDTMFAEVVSGLEPGDPVVVHPDSLPAPDARPAPGVARSWVGMKRGPIHPM